jgi:hypothetical protein
MTIHHAMKLRALMARGLARSVRYRGMLVLVVWQVPIQPVVKPNGSLGLIIGGGSDEHAELSCEGDLIRSDRVTYQTAAVEADYSLTPRVRVDAVAGLMRSDHDSHDGAFATAQLRADWKYFGAGAGIALSPEFAESAGSPSSVVWPSLSLRAGSAEGLHARADVFPPTAFGAQQIGRLGVGYNAVLRDRASGFIGLAGVGSNEGATGVAGELTVPVADRFALRLEGHYANGQAHPVAGLAAGGRFLLGSAPPASAVMRRDP